MIEDGFQIEVDGAGNACGHVIVQVFETPRYPYLLVCTEMRALLSRFRITEGIDNGQSDVFAVLYCVILCRKQLSALAQQSLKHRVYRAAWLFKSELFSIICSDFNEYVLSGKGT